jgi:Lsr2
MQVIRILCDFGDGSDALARRFSLDGADFEIDLCRAHSASLEEAASVWVKHAQSPRRPRSHVARPVSSRRRSAAIRAWALAHAGELGVTVTGNGRIPAAVVRAYNQVH